MRIDCARARVLFLSFSHSTLLGLLFCFNPSAHTHTHKIFSLFYNISPHTHKHANNTKPRPPSTPQQSSGNCVEFIIHVHQFVTTLHTRHRYKTYAPHILALALLNSFCLYVYIYLLYSTLYACMWCEPKIIGFTAARQHARMTRECYFVSIDVRHREHFTRARACTQRAAVVATNTSGACITRFVSSPQPPARARASRAAMYNARTR